MKGTLQSLKNDKSFVWYRFKPEVLSLILIDEIRYFFDKYKEAKIKYELDGKYKKQKPRSFGFHDQDNVYAIMICEDKSINFILMKSHPLLVKVDKRKHKKFDFITFKK